MISTAMQHLVWRDPKGSVVCCEERFANMSKITHCAVFFFPTLFNVTIRPGSRMCGCSLQSGAFLFTSSGANQVKIHTWTGTHQTSDCKPVPHICEPGLMESQTQKHPFSNRTTAALDICEPALLRGGHFHMMRFKNASNLHICEPSLKEVQPPLQIL